MADVTVNINGILNTSEYTKSGYLILIGGQSNSVDRFTKTGNISAALQSTLIDCKTYYKTTYTSSDDGSWQDMLTSTNTQAGTPQTNMFSMGLIIANRLKTTYNKGSYIIPTGIAGTYLADDVNPSWSSTHTGQYYDNMITWFFRKAYPQIDNVNLTPVFLWIQGENDTDTVAHGTNYQTYLTALIAKVRLDTGFPNMKVIIVKLRPDYGGGTPLGVNQVIASQVAVGATVANVHLYETNTARGVLSTDTYHYNPITSSFAGTMSAVNIAEDLADIISTF